MLATALVTLLVLVCLFALIFTLAWRERREYLTHKDSLFKLSVQDARERWLARANSSPDWVVKYEPEALDELQHGDASQVNISYKPIDLYIGSEDLGAPAILQQNFHVLGVMGLDELAWICRRRGSDAIFELDGSEAVAQDLNPDKIGPRQQCFPSIFHYLLFKSDE